MSEIKERRKTCLQCDKPIKQTEGRRERKFCKGTDCSQKYWLATHPKEARFKRIPVDKLIEGNVYSFVKGDLIEFITDESKGHEITRSQKGITPIALPKVNNATPSTEEKPDKEKMESRIKVLENELKSPPSNPLIGLRKWKLVRENEIRELKMYLQ